MQSSDFRCAGFTDESVVDGPGLRAVIFFQGCPHHCPGCHNPQTWNFQGGQPVSVESVWEDISLHPLLQGITLSGGEPLSQPKAARFFAEKAKERGWDVMLFTGYTWEDLLADPDPDVGTLLAHVDILVDGKFIESERDGSLMYRGSRNQRVINVPASKASHSVILWEGESK